MMAAQGTLAVGGVSRGLDVLYHKVGVGAGGHIFLDGFLVVMVVTTAAAVMVMVLVLVMMTAAAIIVIIVVVMMFVLMIVSTAAVIMIVVVFMRMVVFVHNPTLLFALIFLRLSNCLIVMIVV